MPGHSGTLVPSCAAEEGRRRTSASARLGCAGGCGCGTTCSSQLAPQASPQQSSSPVAARISAADNGQISRDINKVCGCGLLHMLLGGAETVMTRSTFSRHGLTTAIHEPPSGYRNLSVFANLASTLPPPDESSSQNMGLLSGESATSIGIRFANGELCKRRLAAVGPSGCKHLLSARSTLGKGSALLLGRGPRSGSAAVSLSTLLPLTLPRPRPLPALCIPAGL